MQEAAGRSEASIREKEVAFVCSPEQRRLWVLQELDSHNPRLNLARCWRIDGKLVHAHLEKAFRILVRRHAALRTSFVRSEDDPVQSVGTRVSFQIPVIDLSTLPEGDVLVEAQRIAKLEAAAPFEISAPPLIRVTHLRLSDALGFLLVTAHRLICDEESIAILIRELAESCVTLQAGQTPVFTDLSVSYGDFAAWQAQRLASDQARVDVEYWRHILTGVKYFEMPLDHPRLALAGTDVRIQSLSLHSELTDRLMNISRANNVNIPVTLLAGLLAVLSRYSGETDIAIGGQFSGRDEVGINVEKLIGPFSHTLLLRHDLSDDPSFAALLARTQGVVRSALQHRYLDIEKLIEITHPSRDGSRNTLFSVNYHFQENYAPRVEFAGLRFIDQTTSPSAALHDLDFSVHYDTSGLSVVCEYNGALFEVQTIERLLKHFNKLLYSAVANPGERITRLTLLDDDEVRMLTLDNNRTAAPYPRHLTVPHLFMRQAQRSPNASAVVCGEHGLSYRQLDMASSRLALQLQKRGFAPGSRICIFLDRSPELMVSLLAVLKAGSAYIPLDPVYPAKRLKHVFDNSRPAAVITRSSLQGRLPAGEAPILLIDKETEFAQAPMRPLSHLPSPSDPAYLIYTSGSTGRPKGVQIPHRALVNLLWSMRNQPGISSADTVVSVTTISFDLVVPDLFLPLICGAKLVFAPEPVVADGAALLQFIQKQRATWMQATPVTWQLLLEAGWRGNPTLKVMCGGEAMTRTLADNLLACGNELWNLYGPTETTVWSAALRVEAGDGAVPIGPPISNTQFYILDARGNLAPPGAPGELYIGGDGVALGYFDQPDLTRERFVPDSFRALPDARLYRTGDIVRMRAPGRFEYLGRADHQVKLRGFRIELGEIESVLLQHPDITEAVAVLGKSSSGQDALWAYAVARRFDASLSEPLAETLRARLAQSLPGYMRPASVMVLEALPRTPNGKIDRRSLPVPATALPGKELNLPSNDTEARLAKIWTGLLQLENIDIGADFFDMGGNSLLAARLIIGIEAEFGKRLSLAALFQAPTIVSQAKLLGSQDAREYDFRQVVRLQPNGTKPPLIAIHNTGVYYYHLSKRLSSEQPLIALQLFDPSIPRDKLPETVEEIAAEYVQLIRQFQPSGPYALLGWCVGGVLAFEVARQLAQLNHEIKLLALIDSWAPGHLSRLPKWRARLSDYSYRWRLILTDWRRVTSYRQGVFEFLSKRTTVKKILRRLGHPVAENRSVAFEERNINVENYDQWLLGYLDNVALRYLPKPYPGKLTLLCSATEPRGLFLDPKMGWGSYASAIDIDIIEGDHFTMFEGKGLQQMAEHIATAVVDHGDRRTQSAY